MTALESYGPFATIENLDQYRRSADGTVVIRTTAWNDKDSAGPIVMTLTLGHGFSPEISLLHQDVNRCASRSRSAPTDFSSVLPSRKQPTRSKLLCEPPTAPVPGSMLPRRNVGSSVKYS